MIERRTPLKRYTRPRPDGRSPGEGRNARRNTWPGSGRCGVPYVYRASGIEAAHTNGLGMRGIGQKASDYSAIPLCYRHHREDRDSYHQMGERKFAEQHAIDISKLVVALNELYTAVCRSELLAVRVGRERHGPPGEPVGRP